MKRYPQSARACRSPISRRVWMLACVLGTSCATSQPQPEFERTRTLVEQSTGRTAIYDPLAPALNEEQIDAVLADGLTLDEALGLALVNNRDLQAEFAQIGIAHANWVQAQLLSNPSIDGLLRFPEGGGRSMIEAVVGVSLLEWWRIPVRTRAAREDLEAAVLRIARSAGIRLADTRNAYYGAVAAGERQRVAEESVALAQSSLDATRLMRSGGVADALDENLAEAPVLRAQLAQQQTRLQAANGKRTLARLLSLTRAADSFELSDPLPDVGLVELEVEPLLQQALDNRLDLRAITHTIEALESKTDLAERQARGDLTVGPSIERPGPNGATMTGIGLTWTPPVFDPGQARISRAEFRLDQVVKLREAAEIGVVQEVAASIDRVNTAARNLHLYTGELLPQAERSLELARASYTAGRTTLLALVQIQRQVLQTRRGYVDLQLEAATAASELERAVGLPLAAITAMGAR